ncbi:MAG: hypothetical protein DRI65_10450 [Chloroflexota bacterium]|nr:MAG: hypothetical protein DRI65_10450 [Chloroflexota bacterium]
MANEKKEKFLDELDETEIAKAVEEILKEEDEMKKSDEKKTDEKEVEKSDVQDKDAVVAGGDTIKAKDKKKKKDELKKQDDEVVEEEEEEKKSCKKSEAKEEKEVVEEKKLEKAEEKEVVEEETEEKDMDSLIKAAVEKQVEESLEKAAVENDSLRKSLNEAIEIVEELSGLNKSLEDRLEKLENQAAGPSKAAKTDYEAIEKSDNKKEEKLNKAQVLRTLEDLMEKGKIEDVHVIEFEASGTLNPAIQQVVKDELDK